MPTEKLTATHSYTPVTPDWRPYGDLRLCFWKFLIVVERTPMTFSVKMLFFAFPSHQRPGLWRSTRPHLIRPSRPYRVLMATKADHTASLAFLLRSYCDHGVPAAATTRRHTLQSMIIVCGFERRPHDVHGDLTATLPRPYYDYCVSTASQRRT